MKKTIEIQIKNQGSLKGTVGWLSDNAAVIKIGVSKSGDQGSWLLDNDGETITTLAIRNYFDDGKITRVERDHSDIVGIPDGGCEGFVCSDACWQGIESLIDIAVDHMEDEWRTGNIEFDVKK